MTKKFLVVFGHGREEGLGVSLRDFVVGHLGNQAGVEVRLHDLLSDGFDPVLRLRSDQPIALPPDADDDPLAYRYSQDVLWADVLVFIHPVWWFSLPAILKGWVDRILVEGIAITQDGGTPQGLLKNKSAVLIQTFGTNMIVEQTLFASMARKFWKRAVFLPTGIKNAEYLSLHSADDVNASRFERFCGDITESLSKL